MGKSPEQLEVMELEVGLRVVGCQYHDWNYEGFLNDPTAKFLISLSPDPDNAYQPDGTALKVRYGCVPAGNVARECLEDVHAFKQAYDLMKPFIKEYNTLCRFENIVRLEDGRIQMFDIVIRSVADVPAEVADAIDSL